MKKGQLVLGICVLCVAAILFVGDGLSTRWADGRAQKNDESLYTGEEKRRQDSQGRGAQDQEQPGQGRKTQDGQQGQETEVQSRELPKEVSAKDASAKDAKPGYRLEDDYYNYCNRALLETKFIPAQSDSWSYFYELGEETYSGLDEVLQTIISRPSPAGQGMKAYDPGTAGQKIDAIYRTAMDLDSRDKAGLGELSRYIGLIQQAATVQEYVEALADISGDIGLGSLFTISGEVDMSDSSRYAWYVSGPDLVLGKETLEDRSQEALWEKYRRYAAQLLVSGGMDASEASSMASQILLFQKDIASQSFSLSDSSDPSKIWNVYTPDQLSELLSHVYLKPVLEEFGAAGQNSYVVMEPKVMEKVNSYLTRDHLPMLKAYSTFCLLHDMAPYLTSQIRDARMGFERCRKGIKTVKTDEKLAGELTQGLLPFTFGQLYVEHYFSEKDKEAVEKMAKDILKTYEQRIRKLDWMSAATKQGAIKKLRSMRLKIGYPEEWPKEAEGAVLRAPEEGGVLAGNALAVLQSGRARLQELWSGPVDREAWQMTPQTVNAYYNPLANEIVFPAAILQAPFYDKNASYEENLGGIGMVIAHEVSHAFDDHGSQYDEKGNYKAWWSEADYASFQQRTKAVAGYYSTFEGYDGRMVDGEQTLGENIADLGAVSCVAEMAGKDVEGLRKLFERYAQIWASKYTAQSMILRLNTDVHSPARVRVNAVLGSTDAFYQAYPEIRPSDGMYVDPEKRVKVW